MATDSAFSIVERELIGATVADVLSEPFEEIAFASSARLVLGMEWHLEPADLSSLVGATVRSVELGTEIPTLRITFSTGATLTSHGWHPTFECWDLSCASGERLIAYRGSVQIQSGERVRDAAVRTVWRPLG